MIIKETQSFNRLLFPSLRNGLGVAGNVVLRDALPAFCFFMKSQAASLRPPPSRGETVYGWTGAIREKTVSLRPKCRAGPCPPTMLWINGAVRVKLFFPSQAVICINAFYIPTGRLPARNVAGRSSQGGNGMAAERRKYH